jgi:hypothetical protein
MSCPHQPLFFCEDCIKQALRDQLAKNGPPPSIFARYMELGKERDELLALVKHVAEYSVDQETAWEASQACSIYINNRNKK